MLKLTSRTSGVAVAAALGLAVSIGTAGAASAAVRPADSAGIFTLCSDGGYGSYAVFPGYIGTSVVYAGNCGNFTVSVYQNIQVDVYEANGTYIGSTIYNGLAGETIVTVAGPSFYVE